jgi:hypothetical protein
MYGHLYQYVSLEYHNEHDQIQGIFSCFFHHMSNEMMVHGSFHLHFYHQSARVHCPEYAHQSDDSVLYTSVNSY